MKIRRSVFCFVAVCVVLIVLMIWFGRKPVAMPPQAEGQTNSMVEITERTVTGSNQTRIAPARTNAPVTQVSPGASVPGQPLKNKGEQMKEGLAEFNDQDVVLYGKVLDQYGSPVANATVAGSIQVNNGTRVGVEKISLATDVNGMFTINGYRGKALGIYITKKGYVMATTNTRFIYSLLWSESERYSPDPNNPAVIKMWKLQGAEPLTGIDQRYKFHFTDAPMNVDLLLGKIVPTGGDIKIVMSRSGGEVSERTLQDWSVQIEAVDGGVIETSNEDSRVVCELPDSGYQPGYTYTMSTTTHSWQGALNRMYYLRSRNGQVFGKLNVGVSINQKPDDFVWVELHGELNPNASRNFEADANAVAMKPQ